LARVRATQEYLLKCNNILLVTNISRAITDQSLKSSLYKVLSRHVPVAWENNGGKGMNIAVVCTRSEVRGQTCEDNKRQTNHEQDINLKAARTEFCGPSKRITQQQMDELDQALENAISNGDSVRKKQIKRQYDLHFPNECPLQSN
jgi:hypothetical protein